jgi:hypothetical protein
MASLEHLYMMWEMQMSLAIQNMRLCWSLLMQGPNPWTQKRFDSNLARLSDLDVVIKQFRSAAQRFAEIEEQCRKGNLPSSNLVSERVDVKDAIEAAKFKLI